MASGEFSRLVVSHWRELREKLRAQDEEVVVEGRGLSLAAVVAAARYGQDVAISDDMLEAIGQRTEKLYGKALDVDVMHGSTPTLRSTPTERTTAIKEVQQSMIRGLHFGILSGETDFDNSHATRTFSSAIPLSDPVESTSMPESWVRASILIRANSLAYETSGVRPVLLERLCQLLNLDVIPRVPLRGSVSASGDLSPLSYIGAVLQGKPAVQAWIGDRIQGGRRLAPADEALSYAEIQPIEVRGKEGMAIISGTAVAAGVACLALHETVCLAAVAQVLTAMSVEALSGTSESFDALFSELRPHPGQVECARNIRGFLSGSRLITGDSNSNDESLAIRTAPQWIGPVLEDLLLAHSQLSVEINSATGSPLISQSGRMLQGGNFQAKAVTSAVEKMRQGLRSLGQLHFAQCTELINPATNKGLAPNLVVDEPSQSGIWKGTDILVAALQSELGFLANPMTSHVQSAEGLYQGINSLALISARYTLTAVDILTQLAAAHLVALCHALDLRALHNQFLYAFAPKFKLLTRRCLSDCSSTEPLSPGTSSSSSDAAGADIAYDLWVRLSEITNRTTHLDTAARFSAALDALQSQLLRCVPGAASSHSLAAAQHWHAACVAEATQTYHAVRTRYLAAPDATPVLGRAAAKLYGYVRRGLEVPFFGEEYLRAAEWDDGTGMAQRGSGNGHRYRSVGAMNSAVYEAMRNGALFDVVVECFGDV
ncbi:phenylalanine ammonia-lyase-like protein [Massariosphaeria phaeospora]|uniref:Phenylalanine ammonia-lyase-like protein n=1 Tax=Massariosphaeria phaeospora TaxID=100035 RepID=A0A7C8MUG9_9PLEO|nr:phenylalanine ammonia-lyase-like protein [Massariosphaeria phaeospora]